MKNTFHLDEKYFLLHNEKTLYTIVYYGKDFLHNENFLIKALEQFKRESWVVRVPYQDIFDAKIGRQKII